MQRWLRIVKNVPYVVHWGVSEEAEGTKEGR